MKVLLAAVLPLFLPCLSLLTACSQSQRAVPLGAPHAELAALGGVSSDAHAVNFAANAGDGHGDDDDDDDDDSDEMVAAMTPEAPLPLDEAGMVQLLAATGFPDKAIPRLICTALFESSFDPLAQNVNRNGTQDTGLFQINDIWLESCGTTRVGLLDPAANARCALKVFESQGMTAWTGFKRQRRTCLRYRLAEAIPHVELVASDAQRR